MTHELECDDFQNDNVDGTCICPRIKDAYARGREDAAQAIINEIEIHGVVPMAVTIMAARGGEQG